jgi:parallel beta-helix repeat protein
MGDRGYGISLGESSDNNISDNNVSNNGDGFGIYLTASSNNTIANNTASSNHWGGIIISSSSNNSVFNNAVVSNDYSGIGVGSSNHSTIFGNTAINNGYGIGLGGSFDINVTDNNISNNDWGMSIHSSTDITADANNFTSDGITLDGSQLSHFNSHEIITSNLVNGKPVYYYKDCSGMNIDGIPIGQLILANCTDTNAVNLNITDTDRGIQIPYSMFINITNSNLTKSGIGVHITSSNEVNITNSKLANGTVGIYLTYSSNVSISENDIVMNSYNGIHVEISRNLSIALNNVSSNKENGVFLQDTPNSIIVNNNVSGNNGTGIELKWASEGNSIEYNNISGDGGGIYLHGSSNNNISGNNISMNGGGISMFNALNNNITNNKFKNGGVTISGWELYHYNSHNITSDNIVNGEPLYYYKDCTGIDLDGIPIGQLIIANCTYVNAKDLLINNTGIGIQIAYSSNTTIAGCSLLNNSGFGMRVESSSNNIVTDNNISTSRWGMQFHESDSNVIIRNVLINNEYGFTIGDSINNRIYHNNFIDNLNQARDYDNNIWNDSYPSGGNYWSDYSPSCQDLYDGVVTPQTTGSPDSICDSEHKFYSSKIDYYPLKQPYYPVKPPTNLTAELTGSDLENLTISWDAALEDPGNVTSYAVYYGSSYDDGGRNYQFLSEVAASGASRYNLTVQGMGEGDPSDYFFSVQVKTTQVFRFSKSDMQVGKFTKVLAEGKHLVSVPLIPGNKSSSDVLQTLKFNIASYYDNADPLDPWKSYNPLRSYNDLTTIDHTMALWIDVSRDSNLTVTGVVPSITNIQLKAGWNFVGYPSFTDLDVLNALGPANYQRIEGWADKPPQYLTILSPDDMMRTGYGYWIKVDSDVMWTVYN